MPALSTWNLDQTRLLTRRELAARPDCLLKLYPNGQYEGECLTLKCEFEIMTLKREK